MMYRFSVCLGLLLAHASTYALPPLPTQPASTVLEVLPSITRLRPPLPWGAQAQKQATVPTITSTIPSTASAPDPVRAAHAAQQDIRLARQTGETRYWGRAQAVLAPWWNRTDAPADLAVLQATVQQGRHEFADARAVLTRALTRHPQHAQGWLNLAALERLSGHYPAALHACDAVAKAGQDFYARVCRLETLSLQESWPTSLSASRSAPTRAIAGMQSLLAHSEDADQQSWLLSLLAEAHERAGQDRQAAQAYRRSLDLAPDLYTAIAYSDLLLRTGHNPQALSVLASLPATDAVLLRRATAWKRLGDSRWQATRTTLQERVAELRRRGDDPGLHGRELALTALWLDDDPTAALALARDNLRLQREPLDWWVALQSARAAQDTQAQAEIRHALEVAGLHDVRLTYSRRGTPTDATSSTGLARPAVATHAGAI